MNTKIRKLIVVLSIGLYFNLVRPVVADLQITVSGNGADSNNTVSVTDTQTTTVSQTSTGDTNNNVTQNADTGNNSASDNTGGSTSVSTGNVNSETSVSTTANTSTVSTPCCDTGTNITVSGNGSDSQNTVNYTSTNTTNVTLDQDATINNNLSVTANTGNNNANNNTGGNVSLSTGSITGWANLSTSVNIATVTVSQGTSATVNVDGNGSGSVNDVTLNILFTFDLVKNQVADIDNDIFLDFDTGNNLANDNTGGAVTLTTGPISYALNKVTDVNRFTLTIENCDADDGDNNGGGNDGTTTTPPDSTSPLPTSPTIASVGGAVQAAGQVLAAATSILPATGASALHFWILAVVYLLTFLFGLYLRLRAGRSPTFKGYKLLAY